MEFVYFFIVFFFAALCVAEFGLWRQNPYRLRSKSFEEERVVEAHDVRGWAPKKNIDFDFYHRYLPYVNKVHFNSLGMHEQREYSVTKSRDVFRVALFGDTCAVGYELNANDTIAAQLKKELSNSIIDRQIEVMNVAARNYCTLQLFNWYKEEISKFKPDIVLYLFVTNHPRRNITFHESGKPKVFSQPLLRRHSKKMLKKIEAPPPMQDNDLIYMDKQWRVKMVAGNDRKNIFIRIRDNSHVVTFLDDLYYGSAKQRAFSDRAEIKNIELVQDNITESGHANEKVPYQWELTSILLDRWAKLVKRSGGIFILAPYLTRYNMSPDGVFENRPNNHPLGFDFNKIPDRIFLPQIANKIKCAFFDTYAYAKNTKVQSSLLYHHDRYGYPTREGAELHAKALCEAIKLQIN